MVVDTKWVYAKYLEFSQKFFGGNMPDIQVKLGRSLKMWGSAVCEFYVDGDKLSSKNYEIRVSNAYDSSEKVKETTLLHEMIHIYDYYNFPEHFMRIERGRLVNNRKYDAHGPVLFQPLAEQINKHGYTIERFVTKEEKDNSVYTDETIKRLSKPLCLCYAEYMKLGRENLMFLCTETTLQRIITRYRKLEYKTFAPKMISVYRISSPEMRERYSIIKGERICGYKFPFDKFFALLTYLGIDDQTPEIITFDNGRMDENRKIIRLTESDVKRIVSETINELVNGNTLEPVDGENAVGFRTSPTSMILSIA